MKAQEIIEQINRKYLAKLKESYAKSDNETTLYMHFKDLLENVKLLKKSYPYIFEKDKDLYRLLVLAAYFHDFGKLNKLFQKKIKRSIKDDALPHNILSVLFLIECKEYFTEDELLVLAYAILNHHGRGRDFFENPPKSINVLILKIRDSLESFEFSFSEQVILDFKELAKKISKIFGQKFVDGNFENSNIVFLKSIILSGLLIRIDHASSGDIDVENEPIDNNRKKVFLEYLQKEEKKLKDFQEKFHQENNLAIVADTGTGKTGLSVIWSNRKTFYILPTRTSDNAMFQTYCKIFGDNKIGLLHSSALFYLFANNNDDYKTIHDYDETKALSKPITITTADQLFTAVFKYYGYEKIYATLSYSDIIIDEIQGFSPKQIVPILKQIEETKKLGARYLIITATLPDIIKEKLENIGIKVENRDKTTFDDIKRHKIKIEKEKSIFDMVDDFFIENKNILVIVNNVSTAQNLYRAAIKKNKSKKIELLHSRFCLEDRVKKEGIVKNPNNLITISTQLVEASLDIDYDVLFTESASADSLIQRFGRIWRHRGYDYHGDYNIFIAQIVDENKVDFVYEKCLRDKTLKLIEQYLSQNYFLLSDSKRLIVEQLYSKKILSEEKSRYFKEWNEIENILNSPYSYLFCSSKNEAQNHFRDIFTIEVVPHKYETKVNKLIERFKTLKTITNKDERRIERNKILNKISQYKVPVPIYWLKDNKSFKVLCYEYNILALDSLFAYSSEIGIEKIEKEKLKEAEIFYDLSIMSQIF